jgi:hypothetical protein
MDANRTGVPTTGVPTTAGRQAKAGASTSYSCFVEYSNLQLNHFKNSEYLLQYTKIVKFSTFS